VTRGRPFDGGDDGRAGSGFLRAGTATVFLARATTDGTPGPRTRVVTLEAPALLAFEVAPAGWQWALGPGLRCDLVSAAEVDEAEVRQAARRTVEALGELLQPAAIPPAEQVVRLGPRPAFVAEGRSAMVEAAAWARPVEGNPSLLGVKVPDVGVPLPPRLALAGARYTVVAAEPLDEIPMARLVAGVAWLLQRGADEVVRQDADRQAREAGQAVDAPAVDRAAELQGVRLLAAAMGDGTAGTGPRAGDPLVAAIALVAAEHGAVVAEPTGGLRGREGVDAVRAVAQASRLFVRRVGLVGTWWVRAASAILAFEEDGTPRALVPAGDGLELVDAATGERRPVDATVAATLLDTGFVFARSLDDPAVDGRSLARIAGRHRRRAVVATVGWALVLALVGLAVPLASGVVFGEIIPESDRRRLWMLVLVLVLAALATLPLQLMFTVSRTRLEAPAALDVQRGVWGRVLRGPSRVIADYGAGDVANRVGGLEALRDPVDQAVLAQVPTLLSGLVAGFVLFHYDASLALIGLAVALAALLVAVALARVTARRQRVVAEASGEVNGFLLQVLFAIPKLRVAAAESRAFLAWAERFRNSVGARLNGATANQSTFASLIPTLGSLGLFTGVALLGPGELSVGTFMAFQTTYGLFVAGVGTTAGATSTTMQHRPLFDRAVELAQVPLESSTDRADPGPLRGAVAFAGVTFRYQPTTRPVLDDLSFRIEPSEMVAIAGHSGCGKSTIMRILLGFETPEQGSVLFDDQDLTSLDVDAVRRQLGVVLQDGQLVPGTVHENLAGVATLSERECWELAEVVALADDIREMPMGMDTVVSLTGGAFSGGQRQRMLIARALAARPRILLLDEATSALDNVTQRVITHNLAQLGMTRIVVAHRLSTMVDADRILVVERGRIVEQGSYAELMAHRGAFHALASRQVLDEPHVEARS
jgi:ATP-binding cassette subfamily C protein